MSDFDSISALVNEMNRDWNRSAQNILDGGSALADQLHEVRIVDRRAGTEFGSVTIDGRGLLRSIDLDADKVLDIYAGEVLGALVNAINSAICDSAAMAKEDGLP
ncbi:hypothetical protein [Nocardia brasiliensis]|uniref:hypothetical protein n=1 Tax=Nocardia brasiliensis TaxID=37326 RepID=UPI00366E2874